MSGRQGDISDYGCGCCSRSTHVEVLEELPLPDTAEKLLKCRVVESRWNDWDHAPGQIVYCIDRDLYVR